METTMEINEIILSAESVDIRENLLNVWFDVHNIEVVKKGYNQYAITNGVIPHIMFYPTKLKLMFQEPDGRNYTIESRTEEGLLGLIKGNIAYRRVTDEPK